MCGIPVLSARSVLEWLCRGVAPAERASLLAVVRTLRIDPHLTRLVCMWFTLPAVASVEDVGGHEHTAGHDRQALSSHAVRDSGVAGTAADTTAPTPAYQQSNTAVAHSEPPVPPSQPHEVLTGCLRDPLDLLVHLHRGLLHSLGRLTAEVSALRTAAAAANTAATGRVPIAALESLTRRWQFLCAMSAFHRLSEDLFVFPAARGAPPSGAAAAAAAAACGHCETEHRSEAEALTALGRLLSDLGSCTRRGAAQVGELLDALVTTAADVAAAMEAHTRREEETLLPELRRRLDGDAKLALVRQTLQVCSIESLVFNHV